MKVAVTLTVATKRMATIASHGRSVLSPVASSAERMRLMKRVCAKKTPPVNPARECGRSESRAAPADPTTS